ncbi:MAG: hypothetical protein HKN03_06465 [Acidimicrobiales bacterium]|nr:hypothetical protein [Acidimicrobiales bacterium]
MKVNWHWWAVLVVVVVAVPVILALRPDIDPFSAEAGFAGESFAPAAAPSGDKPQSKLWYHDGRWWGNLLDADSATVMIHELDEKSQRWIRHDVVIDERPRSHSDVLAMGDSLLVVSMGLDPSDANHRALFSRFSYDRDTQTYSRDPDFPVAITFHGAETIVLAQDTKDIIWVTYVHEGQVLITSSADGLEWAAPELLPVDLADNVSIDDISSIVAFEDRGRDAVGVFFSNQNEGAFVFAVHLDRDPADEWRGQTVLQGTKIADDHINLKSFTDSRGGHIFVAVKTSLSAPQDPLLLLLHRSPEGSWSTSTIGTVENQQTRPAVVIDSEHRQVHVFASAPCCSGGFIFRKSTSLDSPDFEPGLGEVFIAVDSGSRLNNVTTAKHPVDSTTGLVVVASDVGRQQYAHGFLPLDSGSIDLDAFIIGGPSGLVTSTVARFSFAATSAAATFECRLVGEGAYDRFSPCQSPVTYSDLSSGEHRFEVRALDPSHPDVIDSGPASRRWHIVGQTFADSFDEGLLPTWRVESRGTASLTFGDEPRRGQVATFASDGSPRTFVTSSLDLDLKNALTVKSDVRVDREGEGPGHVRIFTFVNLDGEKLGYLYRQNGSGRLWLQVGETRLRTSGTLEVGQWGEVEASFVGSPSGLTLVEVKYGELSVVSEEVSDFDLDRIAALELGYRTTAQSYSISLDELSVGS